jgi:hypothetical protein
MAYDGMDDAMTNQANKQSGLLRRFALTGAAIVAACLATGATFLGYGVDANLPWPVTANTTIAAKYCGGTVQAGTGSTGFFTITVPGVSGFPSNCVVNITNGDTTTLRGKGISGLSGSGCSTQNVLWPGQTCKIGIVNGAWAVLSRPGRWRPPAAQTLQFYSDFVNGSDATGATDGMATGPSAFKTASNCLNFASDQIDFNEVNQTRAFCNPAAATTDTTGVHLPLRGIPGGQGLGALQLVGASLAITNAVSNGGLCEIAVFSTATYSANEIVAVYGVAGATGCNGTWKVTVTDGTHLTLQNTTFGGAYTSGGTVTNGSIISVSSDTAISTYLNTMIRINNIFFQSNATTVQANNNSYIELQNGNIVGGSPSGSLIEAATGSQIHFNGDLGIASGSTGAALQADWQSFIEPDENLNINILPGLNPTFGQFARATVLSTASFGGITINTNGNTFTGTRCDASNGGLVLSGSGNANSYFPGNSNCTQQNGGNIDGLVIPPNPSASALGGIESIAPTAHQWIDSISTSGVPHQSQPATTDLSDVVAPTSWTATDGSGAGLTFAANADTRYVKNGKVCVISFMIQWSTTSDTHTAQINGVPAACTAYSGTFNWVAGGTVSMEVGSVSSVLGRAALQPGGASLFMFGNGNQMTNANMSGGIVRGTITYITN